MIDLSTTNEWQHRDETGMVLPWYTKSFLDELVTWGLKDKKVCEYGGGASTIWWNKKAKHVFTVENNIDCYEALIRYIGRESLMMYTDKKEDFINWARGPHGGPFDIIIIDCEPVEWRQECVRPALECLKPGGILIYDNWMQPSVCCQTQEVQDLLLSFPHTIYKQTGHPDWQTLVATKP